eukprot:COSAG03_NODE_2182_length_3036_cov_15.472932_4_plen_47_part_00
MDLVGELVVARDRRAHGLARVGGGVSAARSALELAAPYIVTTLIFC